MNIKWNIKNITIMIIMGLALIMVSACEETLEEEDEGSSSYPATTKFLSSSLSDGSSRKIRTSLREPACSSGASDCLTPDNIEGRIYAGSIMVGGNGGAPGLLRREGPLSSVCQSHGRQ